MAEQAQITSVEALEAFRSNLIVYLNKARPTLEEAANEVRTTRLWLQNDRRRHWEQELRLRRRKLEEAQQELFDATMSRLNTATSAHHLAVNRAQRAVREAEEKLVRLKKWEREIENRSAPFLKQLDQFYNYLFTEMDQAVGHLMQVEKALEAYTRAAPSNGAAGAGAATPAPRPGKAGEPGPGNEGESP